MYVVLVQIRILNSHTEFSCAAGTLNFDNLIFLPDDTLLEFGYILRFTLSYFKGHSVF